MVFACSSEHCICIFSALFQRSGNFADLHALLCYTRRAYLPERKKKSLQKRRDYLVTFMQIKGTEFFYINYTSIQG